MKERFKPSGFAEEKEHVLLESLIVNYTRYNVEQEKMPKMDYIELSVRFNNEEKFRHVSRLFVRLNDQSKGKVEYVKYCNTLVQNLYNGLAKILKSSVVKLQLYNQQNIRITAKLKQSDIEELRTPHMNGFIDNLCQNVFWSFLTLSATLKLTELQLRTEINELVKRIYENLQFGIYYTRTNKFICSDQNVLYGFYFNYTIGFDNLKINVSLQGI